MGALNSAPRAPDVADEGASVTVQILLRTYVDGFPVGSAWMQFGPVGPSKIKEMLVDASMEVGNHGLAGEIAHVRVVFAAPNPPAGDPFAGVSAAIKDASEVVTTTLENKDVDIYLGFDPDNRYLRGVARRFANFARYSPDGNLTLQRLLHVNGGITIIYNEEEETLD